MEPAILEVGSDSPAQIEAPSNVMVGQSFVVRVTTYGGGCITPERTQVSSADDGAEIWPFDRRHIPQGEGEICAFGFTPLVREVTLAFSVSGNMIIRTHGRRVGIGVEADEAIQIDRTVSVE